MNTSIPGGQFDVKSADELVASSRLNVIEKEHKSFGSLIDHRQLFSLDETPKPFKRKPAPVEDPAVLATFMRGAALEHTPRTFPEAIDKTSPNVTNNSCYANEELIWKTKSNVSTYFQKRVYEDPTLQSFRDSLTPEQKKRNKELSTQALHAIADRYRAEMAKVKEEMDADGVFHPAANAHRVHCMYLMKIYKGISAHTIEDPVLRRLRAESDEKNAAHAADEERKQLLLRIATVGREEVARETAERRASIINTPAVIPKEIPVAAPALARKASMVSLGAIPLTLGLVRRQSQSVLTLDQLLFSSVAPTATPSSEATSGGQEPSFPAARNAKARKRNVPLPQKVDVSASVAYTGKRRGSDCSVTSTGGSYNFAERNSTPLEALIEKDRGDDDAEDNIGADRMTKWNYEGQDPTVPGNAGNIPHVDKMMFNRMRQRRLGAVDARSLLPEEANRLENAFISNPKKEKQRSSLLNNENTMWMLEKLQHHAAARPPLGREGPPSVVPFEVFQKMFEEYSSTPKTDKSKGRKDIDSDGWSGFDSIMQLLPESGGGDDSSIDGSDPESAMNAVQYLAKEDKLFDSFLKMSLRDKPNGRRLTKVSAPHFLETKVKRISAPLGLSAVQLDPVAQDAALASMGTTMQTAPRAENKGRKGTGYMGNTRQPHDKDRRNKGRKASGFTNCFQSQETADFNVTGSSHTVGGIQILPDFTPDEDLQNCIEERRPSNPSLSPEGTIPESAFKPEGFSTGTVRAVTVRRRQREREEEEGENKDKTMTSKSSESEAQAGAMQRKLVQMWDCLQVPSSGRLEFMRKYSLHPYSLKLDLATDLWSEVAVLVMARQEIIKVLAALKAGLRRMPLFASELIDTILMAVPTDLASRSSVFLPLGPPSVAVKVPRGRKDKEDDGSKKSKKPLPLPLSAAMMLSIVEHITQRFGVVTASEAILRCSTHGHSEGRPHRGRRMIPADTFARALASSLIQPGMPAGPGSVSINCRKDSEELKKMKSMSKIVSDDEEDRDSGLQIRSETEAAACLLQLRKIADQLLLASLRKTLDEVNDVATYGTMSVQEWMNTAPPEIALVAVTVSGTPFLSRHQSFATGLTIGSAFS